LRPLRAEILEVNYADGASVRRATEGADAVVHLAGALVAQPGETLLQANTETTRAVAEAAAAGGAKLFVYLSFPGANPASKNDYLRTKGLAEEVIRANEFAGAIFRVPLILGPENAPMQKLRQMARAPLVPLVSGGAVRIQPIAQSDVLAAIEWALRARPGSPMRVMDLVGPETLSYAELLRRVGQRLGRRPRILPVPKAAGWLSALIAGSIVPSLGWNRSVFDILFKEHLADPNPARAALPFAFATVNEILDQATANSG